ncbi:DUF4468 domain-containing protein [Mucilaginibacter dorajii]|uniref:DUF4468 domain-containing protein n=1 Tax=Mucilaginibacter dorajii TaxID=692994 RepID=A0ABP7R505_9SPHI|nr:DUF4468 domain-containing protein [Mucilaginibacter dorajii]MCS3737922.1 hypothetical protein [Mucilaginibacter dorajii]
MTIQKVIFKLLFIIAWMLLPLVNYAQQDTSTIHLPMKNGKITYEQSYPTNKSRDEVFSLAEQWFAQTFPDEPQNLYSADKKGGQIKGVGMFKVITSSTGNYYWLKFDVTILITDGGYTITTGNYFEKPIERGISNEYSKISYRWWDYRQGHPWSVEDKALFAGLNQSTLQIIASLKQIINQ